MKKNKILAINPGSTTTKIAVYEDEKELFETTLHHSNEIIGQYSNIYSQKDFRKELILDVLRENKIEINSLEIIMGRGGLLKPISGGIYLVNSRMLEDLKSGVFGEHASDLGGIIAFEIATEIGKKAYIIDPVVVDEMSNVAKVTGHKLLERKSIFHALNQKAVARKYCDENKVSYSSSNLIVAHLGGGVSVGMHSNGRVIDVNNALDGCGPFSPERTGSLPVGDLIKICFSGKYSENEMKKMIVGNGGIVSYLNTNNTREVIAMSENGNKEAKLIIEAFIYQVAKEIGSLATIVDGKIDQILLTGGIAYSDLIINNIRKKIEFISNVSVYPGENEMSALALGGFRIVTEKEKSKEYK